MFEWEKVLQQQLDSVLTTTQWKRNGLDGWEWGMKDGQRYTVRSGYALLKDEGNTTVKEAF